MISLSEHVSYLPMGENDRPNIGFVDGKKGFLIIDSGNSKRNATEFMMQTGIQKTSKPGSVVITHYHWDHTAGAAYFPFPEYSGVYTKKKLIEMHQIDWSEAEITERFCKKQLSEWSYKNMIREIKENKLTFYFRIPDHIVGKRRVWDLGDIHAIYQQITSCHCAEQYFVLIPEEKILFIGDILWPNMEGINEQWYYNLEQFIELKKELEKFNVQVYVDAHAEPIMREKLLLWMDKIIFLMEQMKIFPGKELKWYLNHLPAQLKHVLLEYDKDVYQACLQCK